jgi:uncharacterized protein DUF3108
MTKHPFFKLAPKGIRLPRHSLQSLCCAPALLALSAAAPAVAGGQGKLEAHYVASLAGIPIGKGVWVVNVVDDQYSAAANGKTTGLLQVFAGGHGTAAGRGTVNGGKPVTSSYESTIVSDKKSDEVRMAVSAGTVKEYSAEPQWPAVPDRVPVTEAHRQNIIDPMSAWLMPVAGNGDPVKPEACQRTLPVFDGRGRFDLALAYKRMERVKSEKGYDGPVVVCSVRFQPISGHRPARSAIKYLVAQRDIEVALAPVAGTRVLVPYRITVPTALGAAVLEATEFLNGAHVARPAPATTNAKTF